MSQGRCSDLDEATTLKEGLVAWFSRCHRICDDLWAEVEAAADSGDKSALIATTERFIAKTKKHLKSEEELLFPMFGKASGMGTYGPVGVMLMEHEQMKRLLSLLEASARRGAGEEVLNYGDTLLMLTQQHNIKEEQILYPMSEQTLTNEWPELHARLLEM